jgi:hypothetical protein
MIQRIQTLYLFLASLALFFSFMFDYMVVSTDGGEYHFNLFGIYTDGALFSEYAQGTFLKILAFSSAITTLITIFLFKKRPLQMKLCRFSFLLTLTYIVVIFIAEKQVLDVMEGGQEVAYQFGTFLPVVAFPFQFLALRGIKRDEDLVKSLDRIR